MTETSAPPKPYLAEEVIVPRGTRATARFALKHYGWLGTLARYMLMKDELGKFVQRGDSREEKAYRKRLLRNFARIQSQVPCGHSPHQFVLIAERILDLAVDGPIVECGAYKGGGTAKLSLLAKRTGRHLYVCDSFQGLPEPQNEAEARLEGHGDSFNIGLSAGEWAGSVEEVEKNVERFGCLDVCKFVPGYFDESLRGLDIRPAFVIVDVDFVSSARECLRHFWPRLQPGGYWYTHEASFPSYIRGLLDGAWWHENLGADPPAIMGAGSGLSPLAANLAYFRKDAPA